MAGILIIAHSPLASSLKAVAAHVYPDHRNPIEALDVEPSASVEQVEAHARLLLERVCNPEALILADVVGATPCNVAARLAERSQVQVVAGVNVPMLWRVLCYANEPIEMLAERAVTGATQGVMQVAGLLDRVSCLKP